MSFVIRNLSRLSNPIKSCKKHYSALYIVGHKATERCVTVNPYIDVPSVIDNIDYYKNILARRKSEIKIDEIKELTEFYLTLNNVRKELEERRRVIVDSMKSEEEDEADKQDKLRMHLQLVKEDIKNLKEALWPVEEEVMKRILSIPNRLHPRTLDEKATLETFDGTTYVSDCSDSHLSIGTEQNLIMYGNPYNYYLMNEAALFEIQVKFFFSRMLKEKNYIQFSNPDIVKSAVVEGCGTDHKNSDEVFIMHHNENTSVDEDFRLHLTGGGSLYAFAAYFTRNSLLHSSLPLRYYCFGRQYTPVPDNSKLGLFEVSQAAVVEIFSIVEDSEDTLNKEIDKIIIDIKEIYKKLAYPFRISYAPAFELSPSETLRVSFEMLSPHHRRFVEVGYISVSDDYVCKRLQITYSKNKEEKRFPKIISGTVLSVPKLLGVAIELNSSKFEVPEVVKDVF